MLMPRLVTDGVRDGVHYSLVFGRCHKIMYVYVENWFMCNVKYGCWTK